jgi:DNA repair protein RecO (recombination protein O)
LTACAVCGSADVRLWSAGLGGAVCARCADAGAAAVSLEALTLLAERAGTDLSLVGGAEPPERRVSKEARGLLVGFTEYHLERRMRSVPMLVRTAR